MMEDQKIILWQLLINIVIRLIILFQNLIKVSVMLLIKVSKLQLVIL